MKLSILVLCCLLTACAMTPTQKKYTAIGLGVLVVGAVAAHGSSDGGNKAAPPIGAPPSCTPQPNGSCR